MTNTKYSVAVLLAAYNGQEYIQAQIESIFAQVNVRVKLFISVDESTDSTYEWCRKLADTNERVVVLPYGERFGGAGENFYRLISDVSFIEYDAVALSDQDDVWCETKLSTACDVLFEGGYDGYSSNVTAFWESGRKILVNKSQPQLKYDYLFESAGPGCTYVLKNALVTAFKEKLYKEKLVQKRLPRHDWFVYAFSRAAGYKWFIDPKSTMLYRQHVANLEGVNRGLWAILKRLSLIKNGWYRQEVTLLSEILGVTKPNFGSGWHVFLHIFQTRRRLKDRLALLLFVLIGLY